MKYIILITAVLFSCTHRPAVHPVGPDYPMVLDIPDGYVLTKTETYLTQDTIKVCGCELFIVHALVGDSLVNVLDFVDQGTPMPHIISGHVSFDVNALRDWMRWCGTHIHSFTADCFRRAPRTFFGLKRKTT